MPLELACQLNQFRVAQWYRTCLRHKTIDHSEATDDRSRGRAEPAGVWNLVAAADVQARGHHTRGHHSMLDGARHQMRGIQRDLTGALAFDFDRESGGRRLDDDLVIQA